MSLHFSHFLEHSKYVGLVFTDQMLEDYVLVDALLTSCHHETMFQIPPISLSAKFLSYGNVSVTSYSGTTCLLPWNCIAGFHLSYML